MMEELTKDQSSKMLKEIASELECPVCFEILSPPIKHCCNGHLVCSRCQPEGNKCCMCEQVLTNDDSVLRVLNKVLQKLPHQCKHKGCSTVVIEGDEHEDWCGYQPTTCQIKECDWEGTGATIVEHVRAEHKTEFYESPNPSWTISNADKTLNIGFCWIKGFYIFKQFFWRYTSTDLLKQVFSVQVKLVPNGEVKSSFKVEAKMSNELRTYQGSTTLTPESLKKPESEQNVVFLSLFAIRKLITPEDKLHYKLSIREV